MSDTQVLTNWKTVVSNSAQFRTLVGAATAADALPYIKAFAVEAEDMPENDGVMMFAEVEGGGKRRFGSTGAGIYTGTISAEIDIKQSKLVVLQPTLTTLEQFRGYIDTVAAVIVSQIESYAISSGVLVLDDIDSRVELDEQEKPDADVWVIQLTTTFGPR